MQAAIEQGRRTGAKTQREHEYVGEAYLMVGDLASAQKQLEQPRKIGLLPCGKFDDPEHEIAEYGMKSSARGSR